MTTTSGNIHSAIADGKPAALISSGLPTVAGAVPSNLVGHLQPGPALQSEYGRLPRPGEREPISGLARSTLLELNDSLPVNERFIIRIRRRGKQRGSTLIVADRLRAVLAREVQQQLGGGMKGGKL